MNNLAFLDDRRANAWDMRHLKGSEQQSIALGLIYPPFLHICNNFCTAEVLQALVEKGRKNNEEPFFMTNAELLEETEHSEKAIKMSREWLAGKGFISYRHEPGKPVWYFVDIVKVARAVGSPGDKLKIA